MDVPDEIEVPSFATEDVRRKSPVCEVCERPATIELTTYSEWKSSRWHWFCAEHAEQFRTRAEQSKTSTAGHQSLPIVQERNTAAETRCEGKTRSTRARKTRSQWLCAIEKVLLQADQPMTAQEIAHAAIARQLVDPGSVWPEDTVRTLIKRHVGRDGNKLSIVIGGSERLRLYSIAKTPAD